MKYYKVQAQPKSHCDMPCHWHTAYIVARDNDDYEDKLQPIIKGCEDWRVCELSKEEYAGIVANEREEQHNYKIIHGHSRPFGLRVYNM